MKKRLVKKILLVVLIVFALLQLIRPAKNKGEAHGPADVTRFVEVPDTVMKILERSCYDCHSNHTNYPWYVEVGPINLLLAYHVRDGKKDLNFSDFSQYTRRRMKSKFSSIAEQVKKREMPLNSYLLMHADADLTDSEIKLIINWTDRAKAELEQKK